MAKDLDGGCYGNYQRYSMDLALSVPIISGLDGKEAPLCSRAAHISEAALALRVFH